MLPTTLSPGLFMPGAVRVLLSSLIKFSHSFDIGVIAACMGATTLMR